MSGMAATKAELRREFLAGRRARPAAELDAARTAIRQHVLRACAERGWHSIAAYVPFGTEPGSPELLAELDRDGRRVLVPVTLPDRDLDWAPWQDGRTGPALGRDAVATVGAAFVPALAVADDGTRLGRGGGSYDRALGRVPVGTFTCVLLYDDEVGVDVPVEPHDRPVTAAASPAGITRFAPTF
jgi:5-formyltetrahydrofolate cyclo-ligase